MNKQELIEKIKANGEWFETNRYVKITKAIEFIKQLDEPQKVKVPKCLTAYIEYCKADGRDSIEEIFSSRWTSDFDEVNKWLYDNDDKENERRYYIAVRAYFEGYEVEEEPKYKVIMPNPQSKNGNVLVLRRTQQGTINVNKVKETTARLGEGMELTEKEIKSVDERYWQFAVPVEKV